MKSSTCNSETWTIVYKGKLADVAGTIGPHREKIFQTMTKDGRLTGWRYANNLTAAKEAADKEGR